MMNLSFKGAVIVEFELLTLTGLRVGGSKENFDIGGLDNPVIKTTITLPKYYGDEDMPAGTPYIPGSSLKGKIRSLLEWATGSVEENIRKAEKEIEKEKEKRTKESRGDKENQKKSDYSEYVKKAGGPCKCGKCSICRVFGIGDAGVIEEMSKSAPESLIGPPRLIVNELYLTKESYHRILEDTDGLLTEIKTENQINRITSRANPRKVERVPAGAVFNGRMVFNIYSKEDIGKPLELVFCGMRLLEDSYLGGYGSRGSGRVKFQNINLSFRSIDFYLKNTQAIELGTYEDLGKLIGAMEKIKEDLGKNIKDKNEQSHENSKGNL